MKVRRMDSKKDFQDWLRETREGSTNMTFEMWCFSSAVLEVITPTPTA